MKPNASPTAADMLEETADLICTMALFGPPIVFITAPWLLLGLVLMGPFAVVVTIVLALAAAAALLAGIAALLTAPVLMLRGRRAARASLVRPAAVQVKLA
jgi:hypothetical protein